jgi:serine/threonine protein kinase
MREELATLGSSAEGCWERSEIEEKLRQVRQAKGGHALKPENFSLEAEACSRRVEDLTRRLEEANERAARSEAEACAASNGGLVEQNKVLNDEVRELNELYSRRVEDLTRRLEEANERAARSERKLERQWAVDKDDVELFEEIGRGSFGTVYRARWQGSDVAVKKITETASEAEKKEAAKLLVNEIRALKRVRHVNVVQMLGACSEELMLLMQLAPGGRTLRHELMAHEQDPSSPPPTIGRRVYLVRGVCAGMVAMHWHGVLHLDIKSTNVVIGGDGVPLIADFGLSVHIEKTLSSVACTRNADGGTVQYKAPELFKNDKNGLKKPADVYSFAMLVWETFTGFVPWKGERDYDIITIHVTASQPHTIPQRPPLPRCSDEALEARKRWDTCPRKIVDLIQKCWAHNPVERLTFADTLEQLDAVASEFPTEDAGRRAGAAASRVEELERRLAIAEAELEQSAAHNQAEIEKEVEALKVERDAARRDRDAIALALGRERERCVALSAATVTFPEEWTEQADDGGDRGDIEWWRSGRQLVAVDRDMKPREWARVKDLLTESLPSAKLVKVERWENRLLWRDYWTKRQHLEVKRGPRNLNEQLLWHGTGKTPPATVLEHEVGPDTRFSRGGFYGAGLYLAERARYSNHDQYVHRCTTVDVRQVRPSTKRVRQLLLCRAALGVSYPFDEKTNKDLKMPPTEGGGVLYDSVCGGPHQPTRAGAGDNDSRMFVLYDLAQAYPEYVVSYTLKSD